MIQGKFLIPGTDDISECRTIMENVFSDGFQESEEEMPLYLLLRDEKEQPVGTAQLAFSFDGIFNQNKDMGTPQINSLIQAVPL